MLRLLHALAVGLVGAGILHILVLFALPRLSQTDAWARLSKAADLFQIVRLDRRADADPLIDVFDPSIRAVACRFDLSEGMMQVSAEGRVPFWSVSIYDRDGLNIYSLNDHSVPDNALDFVVVTSEQMAALQKQPTEDFDSTTFIEVQTGAGIMVVRALVPDPTWERIVSSFVDNASCTLR